MQGNKPVQTYYASILQKGHFVGAGVGGIRLPAPPKLPTVKNKHFWWVIHLQKIGGFFNFIW